VVLKLRAFIIFLFAPVVVLTFLFHLFMYIWNNMKIICVCVCVNEKIGEHFLIGKETILMTMPLVKDFCRFFYEIEKKID